MTNIQKFILSIGTGAACAMLVLYGCTPAHAQTADEAEDCQRSGVALQTLIKLREAGMSEDAINELHPEPQNVALTGFVFRLNERGLQKGPELAEALENRCLSHYALGE